jgi:predicted nucleic acid-binding protein
VPVAPAVAILNQLAGVVQVVDAETYQSFEHLARQRIARRDEDDCPVLAAALAMG